MNGKMPKDVPEENVRRLIESSAVEPEPDFQRRLMAAVLEEVRPPRALGRGRKTGWAVALIAAAAVVAAIVVWSIPRGVIRRADSTDPGPNSPSEAGPVLEAGQVRKLSGLVSLQNGPSLRHVDQVEYVHVGQWVETCSESEAAILLPDESRLSIGPHSRVRIAGKTEGTRLVMERGALQVEAAKQPPGNSLIIETPEATVTVLGTRLEVHVVQTHDGHKQTRVCVLSGKVELESAGRKIVLPANMEGITNEGEPPIIRPLTAEVNEMARLVERTEVLAAGSGELSLIQF